MPNSSSHVHLRPSRFLWIFPAPMFLSDSTIFALSSMVSKFRASWPFCQAMMVSCLLCLWTGGNHAFPFFCFPFPFPLDLPLPLPGFLFVFAFPFASAFVFCSLNCVVLGLSPRCCPWMDSELCAPGLHWRIALSLLFPSETRSAMGFLWQLHFCFRCPPYSFVGEQLPSLNNCSGFGFCKVLSSLLLVCCYPSFAFSCSSFNSFSIPLQISSYVDSTFPSTFGH